MSIVKAAAFNFLNGTNKVLRTEQQDDGRWHAVIRERGADGATQELVRACAITEDEAVTAVFYKWLMVK